MGLTYWQPLAARATLLVLILAPTSNAQFGTRGAESTTNRRELEDQKMQLSTHRDNAVENATCVPDFSSGREALRALQIGANWMIKAMANLLDL